MATTTETQQDGTPIPHAVTVGAYGDAPGIQQDDVYTINHNPILKIRPNTDAMPSDITLGAYGKGIQTPQAASATHVSATPSAPFPTLKPADAPPFDDADAHWLKELGITILAPREFARQWQTDQQRYRPQAWNESNEGRVTIRLFSRGILGAGCFALGQMASDKMLGEYDSAKGWSDQKRFLEKAAWVLDNSVGKGIQYTTRQVYKFTHPDALEKDIEKVAHDAVTFHETRFFSHTHKATGKAILGRSYGHEALAVTLDFGAGSFGDHLGRSIANVLDPNIRKPWKDENGHFSASLGAKALVKNVWTGLTRAMGEDYFAMIMGYPYVMKLSRHLIDKASPGFKYDADVFANGSSLKIENANFTPESNGKIKYVPKVVGNYHLEGMLDLGARFTVYNWYTKIFRDGYDWAGDKITRARHHDKSLDMSHELKKGILNAPRTIARDIIKTTLTMIPAATVFGFLRTAQSRDWGVVIDKELGPMMGQSIKNSEKPGFEDAWHAVNTGGQIWGSRGNLTAALLSRPETHKYLYPLRFIVKKNADEYTSQFVNTGSDRGITSFGNKTMDIYIAPLKDGRITPKDAGGKYLFYGTIPYKGKVNPDTGVAEGYETRFDQYGTHSASDHIFSPVGRLANKTAHSITEVIKPLFRPFLNKESGVHAFLKNNFGIDATGDVAKLSRIFTYASFAYTPYFALKTDILTDRNDTPRMDRANDEIIDGFLHMNFGRFSTGVGDTVRTMFNYPFSNPAYDHIARAEMHEFYNTAPGEGQQNSARRIIHDSSIVKKAEDKNVKDALATEETAIQPVLEPDVAAALKRNTGSSAVTPRPPIVPRQPLAAKMAARDNNSSWADTVSQPGNVYSPYSQAVH